MANSDRDFEDRLRRLELLIAALIAGGDFGSDSEFFFDLDYLFRNSRFSKGDDEFFRFLRNAQFRSGGGRRLFELRSELQDTTNSLKNEIGEIRQALDGQSSITSSLSLELHTWLAISSLGLDERSAKVHRFVPLRVYLSKSSENVEGLVESAVDELLKAFGFEVSDDLPAIKGSWFKKWLAKSSDILSQPEVLERLKKLEKAIEMQGLDLPQAEVDQKKAAAAAQLIQSVNYASSAAVQVGSILIVKLPGKDGPMLQVRTLTTKELLQLENNQNLLSSPADIMQQLTNLCSEDFESERRPHLKKPPRLGGPSEAH